ARRPERDDDGCSRSVEFTARSGSASRPAHSSGEPQPPARALNAFPPHLVDEIRAQPAGLPAVEKIERQLPVLEELERELDRRLGFAALPSLITCEIDSSLGAEIGLANA